MQTRKAEHADQYELCLFIHQYYRANNHFDLRYKIMML